MLKDLVFFTLNDFSKDDGGTVRMYGILNAIAKTGKNVILISNAKDFKSFHKDIKHVCLDKSVSKFEKKYLQFLLGILPFFLVRILTFFTVQNIRNKILYHNLVGRDIVFFEYMDNSIGYILKRLYVIENYINDIHGVASIEFQFKNNKDVVSSLINFIKYRVSKRLDKKVFNFAKGYIFVSKSMKNYFSDLYPFVEEKKYYIVRDGIGRLMCEQGVDDTLLENLRKKYNIKKEDNVVFFAGDFKDLGGILDLINAFAILNARANDDTLKLFLIGDGEHFNDAHELIKVLKIKDRVILCGRIPYTKLRTYQELSKVIVCPDKQHPYSNMVPHIKYFDSLVSNKVVINGSFDSIREINTNEVLSINFEPSNIEDLADKIEYCFNNYEFLKNRFKGNKDLICNSFTYDRFTTNVV